MPRTYSEQRRRRQCSTADDKESPRLFDLFNNILLLLLCVALYLALDGIFVVGLWVTGLLGLPVLYFGRALLFALTGR